MPAEELGLLWWQPGVFTLKPTTSSKMVSITENILSRGSASPIQVSKILGSCTWACLLLRPLLSNFSRIYAFVRADNPFRKLRLPTGVRHELIMALLLFLKCMLPCVFPRRTEYIPSMLTVKVEE